MTSHYDAAKKTLEQASSLVQGDRRETHGDFKKNFAAIAGLWQAYLTTTHGQHISLSLADVAAMMVLLKIARTLNGGHNPDDYVDMIGYASILSALADPNQ